MLSARRLVPVLVLLGGCQGGVEADDLPIAEEERPWAAQEARPPQVMPATQVCPVQDPAALVALEERPDGAALRFRTSGDPAPLRQRAHELAGVYRRGQERPMHGSTHRPPPRPEGPVHPMGGLPAADVQVEELDDGARVVVTGASPEAVEQVRQLLAQHHDRLRSGGCVSLPGGGAGSGT